MATFGEEEGDGLTGADSWMEEAYEDRAASMVDGDFGRYEDDDYPDPMEWQDTPYR